MHRLFVAVDVAPGVVPDLVRLREELPGARWSRPEQYHLTLQFIGDADDEALRPIADALQSVQAPVMRLGLGRIGVFPSPRRPRVLVVHLLADERLLSLQRSVQAVLTGVGVEPEARPFKAHVTLARFKETDPEAVGAYLERHRSFVPKPFSVTEYHLYESVLRPSGAEYRRVQSYPLEEDPAMPAAACN